MTFFARRNQKPRPAQPPSAVLTHEQAVSRVASTLPPPKAKPSRPVASVEFVQHPHINYWRNEFDIVGESFYEANIKRLFLDGKQCVTFSDDFKMVGFRAWLVHEPHNAHDHNAVAVYAGNKTGPCRSMQLGHLPKRLAAKTVRSGAVATPRKGWGYAVALKRGRTNYGVKLDDLAFQIGA